MSSTQDRLNSRTYVLDSHLLWGGVLNNEGYGIISADGNKQLTHRLAWEIAYGPIPEGIQVNHNCDTPPCILPWHLYLGTQADNMQDTLAAGNNREAAKTHCPQGHSYNESNTYRCSKGRRSCRTCSNASHRQRYWRGKWGI